MKVLGPCSSPLGALGTKEEPRSGRLGDLPKAMTWSVAESISHADCASGRAGLLEC